MIYKNLLVAFTRFGILSYGGPSSIPLMHKEVVENYGWMSSEEFADIVAVASSLPGPMLCKLAGYVGYKNAGIIGMIISVCALTIPSSALIIFLLTTLQHFSEYPWVAGMTRAVVPVVAVMLGMLAWQFISISAKELRWPATIAQIIAVGIFVGFFGIHPAIVIAVLLVWALFVRDIFLKTQK